MKFKNVSGEPRRLNALGGIWVEAGGSTPDLDDATAAGLIEQTDIWRTGSKTHLTDEAGPEITDLPDGTHVVPNPKQEK